MLLCHCKSLKKKEALQVAERTRLVSLKLGGGGGGGGDLLHCCLIGADAEVLFLCRPV